MFKISFLYKTAIFTFLFLFLSISSHSQIYQSDNGYVEFVSKAPLLEFKGKSDNLNGLIDLENNLIDFYVDLNTISTGINKRDKDMRSSYLETEKYPFAEFTGIITSKAYNDIEKNEFVTANGVFKIHGVEREIEVKGTLEETFDELVLRASWIIKLSDYDIDRPSILFYELAEEQSINIFIKLKKAASNN